MKLSGTALCFIGILLLGGCGTGDKGASTGPSEVADTGGGPNWAINACNTLPADVAGKAAGVTVTEAKPSGAAESGTTTLSTCNYSAGAESFAVLLRQSPDSTLAEGISGLKANPEMTGPIEDVAVSNGKGFWAPQLKTFTLLTMDGRRLISVTPPGVRLGRDKSDPDDVLKQKALAIAEAAAKAG